MALMGSIGYGGELSARMRVSLVDGVELNSMCIDGNAGVRATSKIMQVPGCG